MPERLDHSVRHKTELQKGYRVYASAESMEVFLADWRKAYRRLALRIRTLEALVAERKEQEANGTWEALVKVYEKGRKGGKS